MTNQILLAAWVFSPEAWLILGLVLVIADIFLGSNLLVLPLGVAALLLSGALYGQGQQWFGNTVLFNTWHDIGIWFAALSVLSIGLVRIAFKRSREDKSDINEY